MIMGHIVNTQREYRLLQKRLDQNVTGAPPSPSLFKILEMLYSVKEAEIASQLPTKPAPVVRLAKKLKIPASELTGILDSMAVRGLVFDLEVKGRKYYSLSPVVIGFFEFTFMRVRDELPMMELAKLFETYMNENDEFAKAVFGGETQLGRTLVREEVLSQEDETEILDWERTEHLITSATDVAVSLCSCRHKASHLARFHPETGRFWMESILKGSKRTKDLREYI